MRSDLHSQKPLLTHSLRHGRERQQPKTNGPGELSLALLDLPGVVLHEHGFERYRKPRGDFNVPALLVKRQTYWAQGYFYAGLLWHGAELLSSAIGSRILVAVTATRLSPDWVRLAAQTAGMGSNASWSWTLLLDFLPTDMPRFRPAPGTVRFHSHCTPGVGFSAASDVCLPACSEAHMMPFEDFNRHGGMDPDTASIAHYYNASRKDALFFFAGSSGADVHNCTSSLGRMVFDQGRGGRCASCYSLCMRQYFHRHFLHHPQMRFSDRGGWQSRSRFCLVAGGAGFDSRMLSSAQLGCIPLWTNRLALPPLFRVLRLETFMISFSDSAADRQRFVKMADLPAFLGCYAPAYTARESCEGGPRLCLGQWLRVRARVAGDCNCNRHPGEWRHAPHTPLARGGLRGRGAAGRPGRIFGRARARHRQGACAQGAAAAPRSHP